MWRSLSDAIDFFSELLAYLSGAAFLLVSLYITYDSAARYVGLPFSGITDEISAYCLAVAGTWGMAYGLKVGAHVRIDLLIAHLGPFMRRMFDILAGGTTMLFAGLLAYYSWGQAYEAFDLGTRSITILQAPLAIPQGLVALGYTLLAIQAATLLLRGAAAPTSGEFI